MEKHLLDDASRDELKACARVDLVAYVQHRGGKVPPGANMTKLVEQALLLQPSKPAKDVADESDGEDENSSDDDQITVEEAQKFNEQPDDKILDWLARKGDLEGTRKCLVAYAQNLLQQRAEERRAADEAARLRTAATLYQVTKGGRIGIGGMLVTLPKGSCVTAHTHDLDNLRAQGIELRKAGAVTAQPDQLGFPRTKFWR